MKRCSEVMTRDPVFVLPNQTVVEAARLMKSENIGPVPIVENDSTRKLVGIVTDRDLALKVVGEGRDPNTTSVQDVMTGDLVTCRADEDIESAMDKMADRQLRRIPVVDGDGKLVGIIAQADVATRVGEPAKTAEVVKEISEP